ncbi:Stage II sporulation protein P (SpoIIP) [Paraliobacillus sp. PM-2]|uniref:stage II sporulation protein P n=1 Tax=Paraliobacillus sp. PM-2 TaxID=1462524 RepID=UPI00061BC071|nr:stage II sporulation protein P [Paraliobacillus sp. PM-2]CQR46902.1 Stage II sporulation protein P (SpoIIP) [Paraliobacillus sp. PM-2]
MDYLRQLWRKTMIGFLNNLRRGTIWIILLSLLFVSISFVTTIKPAYRLSSSIITNWTSQIEGSVFIYLLGMENKQYMHATVPNNHEQLSWSDLLFELATNIRLNDIRSLLGREIPSFYAYDQKIIVAGEGTDYTDLPIESAPPLDVVLEQRDASLEEDQPNQEEKDKPDLENTTGDKQVVFLYSTHNRESFLPHLDGVKDPNQAFHAEVNITKVSERLEKSLEKKGIGTQVDHTDFMSILNQKDWEYWQSYDASQPIVEEALANNKHITYVFDLHRDSRRREDTTTTVKGKEYASLFFVIGSDYSNNSKNVALATELHEKLEEKYPGLSRGVTQQGGAGKNGVYNQDLSDNAILIEFGGVDNTMTELYRSADALAEVFSDYYWDAEAVQNQQ